MDVVKVVLVGYGFLGTYHAQKIQLCQRSILVSIVESYDKNKERAREIYPHVPCVDTLEDVVVEYDAVLIVTPTTTHHELVRQNMLAGKHVFCEKPLCQDYKNAMSLPAPIPKQVCQAGHSERFHSIFDRKDVRNIWNIAGDIINDPQLLVQFTRLAPFKGRGLDVSVAADLLIHDIDLALYIFPEWKNPYLEVTACTELLIKETNNIPDHLRIKIDTDGQKMEFQVGRGYHKDVRKVNFWSKNGVLTIDLYKRQLFISRNGTVQNINYPTRDHLLEEQIAFYDSIINDKPAIIDFNDAKKALFVLDKISECIKSDTKQIDLIFPIF